MKFLRNTLLTLLVICCASFIGCGTADSKPNALQSSIPAEAIPDVLSGISTKAAAGKPNVPQSSTPAGAVLHVSSGGNSKTADGSSARPFPAIANALAAVKPGTTVLVHAGTYQPFEVGAKCSGTKQAPVTIRAAEGAKPVIRGGNGIGVHLVNVDNFVISGLEVIGGTHGIYYESTPVQGGKALENIIIQNCVVHDINGTHGICVYAANDKAPVKNITMENCEVYNCRCDSSESTVFNGNIDGFTIRSNKIHHNNNIGIDMIGFEGTAKHGGSYNGNAYDVDFARNGKCYGNVVYAISTAGNEAYREGTGYSLCAGGIYVDGGQNIEIYNNFIYDCDIGIEVATEHSPKDNPLFHVSGVGVHDNIIANCEGYCGLAFGGYDAGLGLTEGCSFRNNTFIDNPVQMVVQRSARNQIHHNLFVGGEVGVEYNTDCAESDLVNEFGENGFCMDGDMEDLLSADPYGTARVFPKAMQGRQRIIGDRKSALNSLRSGISGLGSAFMPDAAKVSLYTAHLNNKSK